MVPEMPSTTRMTADSHQWAPLHEESDASKALSFGKAFALHAGLVALMFVGFSNANLPKTERAGQPLEFFLVDQAKAPKPQPIKPQRVLPKPAPTPVAQTVDTVTDNKPIVPEIKIPDPTAIEEAPPEPIKPPEPARVQNDELDKIREQREQAARERKELEDLMAKIEREQADQAAPDNATEADVTAATTGDVIDNSLLAQYRSAIASTVEARSRISSELRPGFLCWVRITQLPGGEVISVVPQSNCNANARERDELVESVMRASPLPYSGFEEVFDRLVDLPFEGPK
jgi:colicin import membrane protein